MIEFEGVTLAYAAQPVLRDVTFGVPEGELLLVVGPTGSGKSSLLRCLDAGLARDPDQASARLTGRVLVDGADLHAADPLDQRPLVGRVPRTPPARSAPGRWSPSSPRECALGRPMPTPVSARWRRPSTCSASPT